MTCIKRYVMVGILGIATVLPQHVWAHGGEDHGEAMPSAETPVTVGKALTISKETQFLMGLRTQRAQHRVLTSKLKTTGKFIPRTNGWADVTPVVTGRVVSVQNYPVARIGQRVAKGDTLAVLEQLPQEQFALDAAYHTAKSELEQAQKEYARHKELRQISSVKEFQQAEARLKVAEAAFKRLRSEMHLYRDVHTPERTVHHHYLRAPIAGIITETQVVVGAHVGVDRWLFRIIDLDPLWVEASVYEADLPTVETAQRAVVTSRAYPHEDFKGHLIGIGGTLDETTRTAKAIFEVRNPGGRLKSGMFAEVGIDTGEPVEGTTVPLLAVLSVNGKNLVYVHTKPEEFVPREVVLGQKDGDFIEIKSGIVPEERVVTVGAYQLWSEGLK